MRRARILAASAAGLALVALAVVGVLVLGAPTSVPREGGPLAGTPAFGYAVTLEPGSEMTDALTVLALPAASEGTAKILAVEQVFRSRGLTSAGEWVSGDDRSREAAVVEQYYTESPPADSRLGTIRDAAGAAVEPSSQNEYGTQLLLGIRVDEAGRFVREGVWITYTYVGHTYRDFVPAMLTVCTPPISRHACSG